MQIIFKTLPLSTNQLYRVFNNRILLSAKGRANKEALGWEARSQFHGKPLAGPLSVSVSVWWPTRRNHDIENLKAFFDSLSGIVYEDDGQIVELHLKKGYDKENPRIEMTLSTA